MVAVKVYKRLGPPSVVSLLIPRRFCNDITVLVLTASASVFSTRCARADPLGIPAVFCYLLVRQRPVLNPSMDKRLEESRGTEFVVVSMPPAVAHHIRCMVGVIDDQKLHLANSCPKECYQTAITSCKKGDARS